MTPHEYVKRMKELAGAATDGGTIPHPSFQRFAGMSVLINDSSHRVARSWRERLLTLPWRPFRSYRVEPMLKHGEVMKFDDKLLMNSSTLDDITKIAAILEGK